MKLPDYVIIILWCCIGIILEDVLDKYVHRWGGSDGVSYNIKN